MSRRTLVDRVLDGEVLRPEEEIEREIEAWHEDESSLGVEEWLGMSTEEYRIWLERPAALPLILQARRYDSDLVSLLKMAKGKTALAARGANVRDVEEIRKWLRSTGRI